MERVKNVSRTPAPVGGAHIISPDERAAAGKALRDRVPREQHGAWKEFKGRPSPINILQKSDASRMKELVPIRYGRMLQSPFAFYRGSAGLMASDLARTPNTGLQVQACGDCHLMSDIFLGWVTGLTGRHLYVRQLRDAKIKPLVETADAELLDVYAMACGWVLARAHAKVSELSATISGYLGSSSDVFDVAMGKFALAYADQAERDHAALKAAVRKGKIAVYQEA